MGQVGEHQADEQGGAGVFEHVQHAFEAGLSVDQPKQLQSALDGSYRLRPVRWVEDAHSRKSNTGRYAHASASMCGAAVAAGTGIEIGEGVFDSAGVGDMLVGGWLSCCAVKRRSYMLDGFTDDMNHGAPRGSSVGSPFS